MINNTGILTVFMEGARISSIAELIVDAPDRVEDGLRSALREIYDEYVIAGPSRPQPPTTAETPQQGAATVRAAASSPLPEPKNHAAAMKRSPARKAVERIVEDLSDYPESLRNPLAKAQRAIYEALRDGPKTTLTLAPLTGLTSATISTTLYTLRDRRIVRGDECMPVNWSLVE